MQRFTLAGFTGIRILQVGSLGATRTLKSAREASVDGIEGEVSATRTTSQNRGAEFNSLRCQARGVSLALPDLSLEIVADFEEA